MTKPVRDMNFRTSVLMLVAWLGLALSAPAVKVDLPGEAEDRSSHIVTGTISAIYSRVVRDARYEWHHAVAAVRVESIQKARD